MRVAALVPKTCLVIFLGGEQMPVAILTNSSATEADLQSAHTSRQVATDRHEGSGDQDG